MSTHVPGFQLFSAFLRHSLLAKLATSSIRVNLFMLAAAEKSLTIWLNLAVVKIFEGEMSTRPLRTTLLQIF